MSAKRNLNPIIAIHLRSQRNDKYYTLQLDNRVDTVSVDRLKSAHLEFDLDLDDSEENQIIVHNSIPLPQPGSENNGNQIVLDSPQNLSNTPSNDTQIPSRAPEDPPSNHVVPRKVSYNTLPIVTRSGRVSKRPIRYQS